MEDHVFQPADILLPADSDMTRWSVIACDQFTSDERYWNEVETVVGDAPSTLRLMLPEFYLGKCDEAAAAERIQRAMHAYLDGGAFRTVEKSYVYLERTLPSGAVRRGLIGQVDLEAYDFAPDAVSPIRATEGTVASRLPPRVQVRRQAALEMPHIMLFLNDAEDAVMPRAAQLAGETLYDFDLMLGGGHVHGRRVSGAQAETLSALLAQVTTGQTVQFAVGDGNHSLAAARQLWLEKRETLSAAARKTDPARYALVELVNIHDPAITFKPIHRALFHTDADDFFAAAERALSAPDAARCVTLLAGDAQKCIPVRGASIGAVIDAVERFCRDYLAAHGGEIDYIHGDDETIRLAAAPGCAGVLLPQMEKEELFSSVAHTGPFPKKSFSIGLGPDKRYYLECRKL